MVEEKRKYGELEQEFGELEAKLVEKIKLVYKENLKKYPAGVSVEVASDEDKDFRLYIDSNRGWDVRYQMSGFEIGGNPNLSRILDEFVFVTDTAYRGFDKGVQEQYLQANRGTFARSLMEKMQQAVADLG